MPITLTTDTLVTTTAITNPSSQNLLMLMIITGGLLFICLVLLVIVIFRSRARRKKAQNNVPPSKTKEVLKALEIKQEEVVLTPPNLIPENKKVVEVAKIPEPVKIIIPELKKEVPPIIKIEEEKKEVFVTEVLNEKKEMIKKPEEVIIVTPEKKPELKKEHTPYTTTIEDKKKIFNNALEETKSKDDNLKILQERLAELSKEKTTKVSFIETQADKFPELLNKETPKVEDENKEKKILPTENTKLVDLTALINEKLQGKTQKNADPINKENLNDLQQITPKAEVNKEQLPEIKTEPVADINKDNNQEFPKKVIIITPLMNDKLIEEVEELPLTPTIILKEELKTPYIEPEVKTTVNDVKIEVEPEKPAFLLPEDESHKILTPFFDKIKSNSEANTNTITLQTTNDDKEEDLKKEEKKEEPQEIIKEIEAELISILENEEVENNNQLQESKIQQNTIEKPVKENNSTATNTVPKTFTEWLSTLKK